MAQLRVLGGSLGISVSTVLLHHEVSKHLVGVVTPQGLSTPGGGLTHLSPSERDAVRTAYSEAFRKGMVSASVVSAVAVLSALGGYRRERSTFEKKQAGDMMNQVLTERTSQNVERATASTEPTSVN